MLTLLLLACTAKTPAGDDSPPGSDDSSTQSDDSGADDSGADDSGADDSGYPEGLHGEIPAEPVDAPEFSATNYDGGARGRADLLGHRTVVWFFPSAGTFG